MQEQHTIPARRRASPSGPAGRGPTTRAFIAGAAALLLGSASAAQDAPSAPAAAGSAPAPRVVDTAAAASPPRPAASVKPSLPSSRLYEIRDQRLVRETWSHAGRTTRPEPGRYQILVVSDSTHATGASLLVLREGTQAGSLPDSTQLWLRERMRSDASLTDGTTRSLGAGFWANFWNPDDKLAPYRWPTGLEAAVRMDGSTFRNTTPLFGQHYDLVMVQRPFAWLTAEVGGHVSRHAGGLYRNLYDPVDSTNGGFSEYAPWWHAAVGVPGVKWEVSLSNREFPEYYWLDPEAGGGTYKLGVSRMGLPLDSAAGHRDGALMKRWRAEGGNPKPSGNNLAHSLHLKAGSFRYRAVFDRDVYRSTIHQLMIEEIQAPFGQWALGFVAAEGVSHTRVRLDLFPLRARVGPQALDARLRAFLLRVNLDYRDASTFHLGFSTTLHLDAATLRPGDKP